MHFDSKLPDVGTTIFTVMSRRALEENALNVGQGFPDYSIDPRLSQALVEVVAEGHNQYAPMEGVLELREQIARKLHGSYELEFDPLAEITVTCGGTEALYDAVQAVVHAGDEVIVFDPAYDAYEPAVRLAGGRCLRIPLSPPHFRFDWERVRQSLTDRTRLIVINSPQNPCCTVADAGDLDMLAALIRDRPISILSDEVYEHVLYDGRRHASVLAHPELRQRSFAVFSFGKTLHATGWRVGYCVAPAGDDHRTTKSASIQHVQYRGTVAACDRTLLVAIFRMPGRACPPSSRRSATCWRAFCGAPASNPSPRPVRIFNWWTYGALSSATDTDFADRLIREAKVATIPLSPFYAAPLPMDPLAPVYRQTRRNPRGGGATTTPLRRHRLASESLFDRRQILPLTDPRRIHEHAPGPAVHVVFLHGPAHQAHAVAALVAPHAHGDFHGLRRFIHVEGIDEHRLRQLTRGAGEGTQDEHAVLVIARGHELLGGPNSCRREDY